MSAVRYHAGIFSPHPLDGEKLIPLVGPASAAVARYDGVLSVVPNATLLLSPLTTQEAVLSSKIEGPQATMRHAEKLLLELPFCQRVVRWRRRVLSRFLQAFWRRRHGRLGSLHEWRCPDRLIQLAILHAEFEALHPFLDGNKPAVYGYGELLNVAEGRNSF